MFCCINECKSLKLRVIDELKGCDDIVIMKFDKGCCGFE